jgi:CubicO group peptidase (beta-lactamase class C family)
MSDRTDLTMDRLQRLLLRLTTRKPINQAILAVESFDQSFRWIGAKGETISGGQVLEDTPFFIASIDKLYNATIAMLLSETGQLLLDDPITAYLPNTITRGLHQYRGTDFSERITVRHLLSHTSGLADWLEDYPKGDPSLVERVIDEGDRVITIEELVTIVRDHLRPHFPPQDLSSKRPKVRYSDTNFMLIIAIIEAVTEQPLHQVHKQLLYKPLGLHHTYFPGLSQPLDSTQEPMMLRVKGLPLSIPLLMRSIRGIYSTATDTLTFLRQLVRNEVFQNPNTFSFMQSSWHRFGFPLDRAALRSPGWPIEYGIGIMRFRLPRIFSPTAPMPSILGHTGSTGCWLFYCPEWDVLLSGSVNEVAAGAVPYRTIPKILKILRTLDSRPIT